MHDSEPFPSNEPSPEATPDRQERLSEWPIQEVLAYVSSANGRLQKLSVVRQDEERQALVRDFDAKTRGLLSPDALIDTRVPGESRAIEAEPDKDDLGGNFRAVLDTLGFVESPLMADIKQKLRTVLESYDQEGNYPSEEEARAAYEKYFVAYKLASKLSAVLASKENRIKLAAAHDIAYGQLKLNAGFWDDALELFFGETSATERLDEDDPHSKQALVYLGQIKALLLAQL